MATVKTASEQKPKADVTPEQQQELAAYEKLRHEVKKILDQSLDAVSADKISQAIERGQEVLKKTGEHTQEQVNQLGKNLKKDLLSTFKTMQPPVKELSETVGGLFDLWFELHLSFWSGIIEDLCN